MPKTRLIFFGTEDFSATSLEALITAGFDIAAVVTKPDFKAGRGQQITAPKVKQIALASGIEVWQPTDLEAINDKITSVKCDIGVLVSYGKIIPGRILDLFSGGIINVHPSLLPKYRGPSPIEAAILAGDKQTGVSLIKLTPKMDAGPIYAQATTSLSGSETKPQLYPDLARLGAALLVKNLNEIMDGSLLPTPQIENDATYSTLLRKEDGFIDWTMPAKVYERQIRAYQGFPKSSATVNSQKIIITKARVASTKDDGGLVMPCLDSFLEIEELVAPSGKTMSGTDFLLGYKK